MLASSPLGGVIGTDMILSSDPIVPIRSVDTYTRAGKRLKQCMAPSNDDIFECSCLDCWRESRTEDVNDMAEPFEVLLDLHEYLHGEDKIKTQEPANGSSPALGYEEITLVDGDSVGSVSED